MQDCEARTTNGVNVDALRETLEAVREIPAVARFRFRASTGWVTGGRSRTRIAAFHGAGQERRHQRTFVVESDLPAVVLGTDRAANPSEYVLAALASCVIASLAYHGAARGIRLDGVAAEVTGEVDLRGFLGVDGARAGCNEICVALRVTTDATDAALEALVRIAAERSPVLNMLSQPVPVRVVAERSANTKEKETDDV